MPKLTAAFPYLSKYVKLALAGPESAAARTFCASSWCWW